MFSPEKYAELAAQAEARKDFATAAMLWRKAKTASAGHNRRERYQMAHDRCMNEFNKAIGDE